jgi:protein-S-isoprenylcysteine O-methyltransferase Ste14
MDLRSIISQKRAILSQNGGILTTNVKEIAQNLQGEFPQDSLRKSLRHSKERKWIYGQLAVVSTIFAVAIGLQHLDPGGHWFNFDDLIIFVLDVAGVSVLEYRYWLAKRMEIVSAVMDS